MFGFGPMELIVLLIIALLVLGPKKLPDAGKALGEAIRGFKSTINADPSPIEKAALIQHEDSPVVPVATPVAEAVVVGEETK
jgi:sec-independent protein translocase protein TatA